MCAYQNSLSSQMSYAADMVFCIDATGSMEDVTGSQQRIINMVKQNALNLYKDIETSMAAKNKNLAQLRVRIVIFRDFMADGSQAMMDTDFFHLPEEEADFEECIRDIVADGGGDIPEDGLEALAFAIKSKWTNVGSKRRHIIVVWTDAPTHPLGYGKDSPYYPKGLPTNLMELEELWDTMDEYARRLILFAPNENYWNYISDNWEQTIHIPSVAGNGLAEQTYDAIVDAIANSI